MPYFLQEEPQDGTTIMNNAVRNGAIQEQQNLIDRARQAAIEQDPTLNFVERRLKSGLLDAKMGWQDAYNKGDAQGMVNAQKAADNIRQQAAAIGFQDRDFGADATLEQVAQNLANNDTRAINDLFYGMKRPGNYYQTSYDQYRDSGMSMNDAARNAQRDADNYQNENVDRLIDAFHMYGTDPRGAINQNGLRLLGMMAQQGGVSPSELVNFYAQMQASPKDNWNFENQLIAAENADRYARGRQVLSGEIQEQLAQNNWNRSEQTANNNVQRYLAQAEGMVGIKAMDAQTQAAVRGNIVKPFVDNGQVTPEMAANYVATGYLVPKGANSNQQSKEKPLPQKQQGFYNQLADALERAQDDIKTGVIYEVPDDEGSVEAYRKLVEEGIAKGYITGSDITKARDYANMLQYMFAMNAETPDTAWAEQAYNNMSPDFQKENASVFANIKAPKQTEEPNKKDSSWEKRDWTGLGGKF